MEVNGMEGTSKGGFEGQGKGVWTAWYDSSGDVTGGECWDYAPGPSAVGKADAQCWICGEYGHYARECPKGKGKGVKGGKGGKMGGKGKGVPKGDWKGGK